MTTVEKITTLNWFDFLRKIKEILSELAGTRVYPTYADSTTAKAGGLKVNDAYRTAGGDLKVVV